MLPPSHRDVNQWCNCIAALDLRLSFNLVRGKKKEKIYIYKYHFVSLLLQLQEHWLLILAHFSEGAVSQNASTTNMLQACI